MLSFIMIGKINERVPESERMSHFWWGTEVRKRYERLYPAGKLALLATVCLIFMVLCFLLLIRFWVFGSPSAGKEGVRSLVFIPAGEWGGGVIGSSAVGAYVGTPERFVAGVGGGGYLTITSNAGCSQTRSAHP
jgi:hypothetical protein